MMRPLFLSLILFSFISLSPASADPPAVADTPVADNNTSPSYFVALLNAATQAVSETVTGIALGTAESTREIVAAVNENDDPLEKYNRMMFRFNQMVDEKALLPLASNYQEYTPDIVQTGVSNFFSNLGNVGVMTNSVLQGKFDQALNDSSRLAINTIAGLGGVIDVASLLDLDKNHEDFGQTFGVWGVPEGPYIVLPVLGPRTMRSAFGTALDTYLQVETLGAVSEAAAWQEIVTELLALNLIQQRARMLGKTELLEQASLDPYVFTREAYLAYRRCQVVDCDKIDYQPSATPELLDDGIDELDLLDELEPPQDFPDELDLLDKLD